MNELNKISNESLLNELKERLNKGEIKCEGGKLVGKSETNNDTYYTIPLNINVGKLVNEVIDELTEERNLFMKEKEIKELELRELRKTVSR